MGENINFDSKMFGDKEIFAVEILYNPSLSKEFTYGLFYYWVKGKRVGNDQYFNLTDVLSSMRWIRWYCGKRKEESLCGLTIKERFEYVRSTILELEIPINQSYFNLIEDVQKFNLMFHPHANGNDWLLLMDCDEESCVIHLCEKNKTLTAVYENIIFFESILTDSYSYLSSLARFEDE